jgi:hypothetical protein
MLRKEGAGSSRTLLVQRALCDFGIGLRFVLSPVLMKGVCGEETCNIKSDADDEDNCTYAAGMLQFFEMASEAWFLCLAYDLAVTITNPFSSPAGRVWGYHSFCWIVASVYTIAIVMIYGMAGYWYVDEEVDEIAICWVQQRQSNGSNLNYKTFVFLYIPLALVYSYALRVIFGAYGNLKKGISKTFQHRVRVLLLNGINIGIYVLYWFVLFIFYFFAYALSGDGTREVSLGFWRLLWFFLSSKGFADLLVYVFISDGYSVKSDDESTAVDFNAALRQEVLHYATTGIRECAARKTSEKTKNKVVLIMTQKNSPLKSIFNVKALIKIVFDGEQLATGESDLPQENSHHMETETMEVDEEGARPNSSRHYIRRSTARSTLSVMTDPAFKELNKSTIDSESGNIRMGSLSNPSPNRSSIDNLGSGPDCTHTRSTSFDYHCNDADKLRGWVYLRNNLKTL